MRIDAINSKVLTITFFSLHNFICYKLARFIHTLKFFVSHSTPLKKNLFSIISSLAMGHITPKILLPTHPATIVQEPAAEEIRKVNKLTPAV